MMEKTNSTADAEEEARTFVDAEAALCSIFQPRLKAVHPSKYRCKLFREFAYFSEEWKHKKYAKKYAKCFLF